MWEETHHTNMNAPLTLFEAAALEKNPTCSNIPTEEARGTMAECAFHHETLKTGGSPCRLIPLPT